MKTFILNAQSKVTLMCLLSFAFIGNTYAEDSEKNNPYEETFKVELPKNAHTVYIGGGLSNKLIHAMVEVPTSYGNIYTKVGQYNGGQGVAGLVGYRYPYKLFNKSIYNKNANKKNNGVYVGAFAGHVMSSRDPNSEKDDKRFNRLGAGIDVSYLWFDSQQIGAVSMGVFLPQKNTLEDDKVLKVKPQLMLSVSLSAGMF